MRAETAAVRQCHPPRRVVYRDEYKRSINFIFFFGILAMTIAMAADTVLTWISGHETVSYVNIVCISVTVLVFVNALFRPAIRPVTIAVIAYFFLCDVIATNVYYFVTERMLFMTNLLKDLFFLAGMMAAAGFSGGRKHPLIIGLISCFLIALAALYYDDRFFRESFVSILMALAAFATGLFLFVGSLEKVSYEKNNNKLLLERQHAALQDMLYKYSRDLEVAGRIQSAVFSQNGDSLSRDILYMYSKPMIEVGGDIFDFMNRDGNSLRLFIADANGHGVQAALVTMLIKSEYDRLKMLDEGPEQVLQKLNRAFAKKNFRAETIFTCVLVDVDFRKGQIHCASAGHPPQYLLRGDEVIELKARGPLAGVLENAEYEKCTCEFRAEDFLLLFTDGIFEVCTHSGERMGETRIRDVIASASRVDARTIVESIIRGIEQFRGGTQTADDIMIVALKN